MILDVESEADKTLAEKYFNKEVAIDNELTGLLIAIYEDTFETTAGLSKTIDTDPKAFCLFGADYMTSLPVTFHNHKWVFPDGREDNLLIEFYNQKKPYKKESDKSLWSSVTATVRISN